MSDQPAEQNALCDKARAAGEDRGPQGHPEGVGDEKRLQSSQGHRFVSRRLR